jgi:hypothetical protein
VPFCAEVAAAADAMGTALPSGVRGHLWFRSVLESPPSETSALPVALLEYSSKMSRQSDNPSQSPAQAERLEVGAVRPAEFNASREQMNRFAERISRPSARDDEDR